MKNDYEIRGDITAIFLNRKDGTVLETLVSTSDLDKLKVFPNKWCAKYNKSTRSYYAKCSPRIGGKRKTFSLHRWLLDNPVGYEVDHMNHDTLDNRENNLRIVTKGQNGQNRKGAQVNSDSGIRGVTFHKPSGKWQAQYVVNKKTVHVGLFKNIEDAEKAVIQARKEHMPFSVEKQALVGAHHE